MCGIVGIYSHEPVAAELYDSLIHLQHRGQDACGILTCDDRFYPKHGLGLVRESIFLEDLHRLKGNVGIAHARYPTAGGYSEADIQPLWIGSPRGIALAHNGNLVNYQELVDDICGKQHRHLNSTLDSEALLLLLADNLAVGSYSDNDEEQFFNLLCNAVNTIYERAEGSYSVVSLVIGKGLVAFRDPHGIRPLVWGERVRQDGTKDYIFASETTSFYALGFEPKGDIKAGEVAYVNNQGQLYRRVLTDKKFTPCIFEYVYFARPDATLDDVSVYRARLRMGQNLAKSWKETYPDLIPDVVIPAPSTANTAALAFANELGIRYSEGLYKNPFIGRTFIMPNQESRSRQVRYKLTPQKTEINKKKVLIVDDSIVRGTTSREIVKMIREFGALEIYFVSTCPPIKNPCFYGIDIPSRKKLIAAHKNEEEIRAFLGVDKLLYQRQDDLIEAVTRRGMHHMSRPCMACMDGNYICGKITEDKIKSLEKKRIKENGIEAEIGEIS
ncbi:amidophosphoribosyltransferase [Legionella bononiensis]|uniref:Amidophosphoribosyltransferase n=1 Tax=Legionella bononiensis TaxID=2793102 RepID=A0ABS1WCF3_9GAMM|nr:amidophosphoribosyltransferase [Legionella bononiensis]MBL7478909.1 amidophosphoribosyltransferase [Legionella bononiensis]MBL7527041.1 amidophosphoribosyltransferase [Legionella bononiensis]MBL7562010.1 amidophosphoribosyltransferase [Legionella bononiensis]